ncbi:MAG: hypothetical protein R3C56_10500 [Pirellulaceae bacterium]
MIVLLGISGYVGGAFQRLLQQSGEDYVSYHGSKWTIPSTVIWWISCSLRPQFLINAAGYTGKPNVDACEIAKADALRKRYVSTCGFARLSICRYCVGTRFIGLYFSGGIVDCDGRAN